MRNPSNWPSGVRTACAAKLVATAGVLPVAAVAGDIRVSEGETANVVKRLFMAPHKAHRFDYTYETRDGSTLKNVDFEHVSGTLSFWPGERSKALEVEIYGDRCKETDETFTLEVTGGKCTTFAWPYEVGGSCSSYTLLPDERARSFEVTIVNVGGHAPTYEDTKYGGGGDPDRNFGE